MELNYNNDLDIDGKALDQEWMNQAKLFMKYSEQLVEAKDRLGRQTENLEITKADADARARKALTLPDAKAPTVDAIRAAIQKDGDVQKETTALLEIEHEVGILTAAVRAFDHRKAALENLVTLHGQQYFAGPSVPYDIGREFVKHTREMAHEDARDRTVRREVKTPEVPESIRKARNAREGKR